MGKLICYCFDYTDTDIELDQRQNGRSTIMEKILAEKRIDPPSFSFPLGFSGSLAGFTSRSSDPDSWV